MRFLQKFWTVDCVIVLFFLCQELNSTPNESVPQSANRRIAYPTRKTNPPVQIDYADFLEKSAAIASPNEPHLQTRGGLWDMFGGSKAQANEPKPENPEPKSDPKKPAPSGWLSKWTTPKPTQPQPSAQKHGNQNSGSQWPKLWSSNSPETPKEQQKTRNVSARGWLDGWGTPSTTAEPEPESESETEDEAEPQEDPKPSSGGLLGSWFSGSPAPIAAADGKKSKQHGPIRQFVKSIEHAIVPKAVRHTIKKIPGVHSSRRAMKSTLDAIDSIGDSEYVTNIRNAAEESSKRVGLRAVNLADSMLELGTGTSDVTLNMVNTLQKEGARTLDTVSVACPPAKSTVDYVNHRVSDGVGMLQKGNNQIRNGGKFVLSKITSYAKLEKEKEKEKEAEAQPPSSSWW